MFLRITIGVCGAVLISSAWNAGFPLLARPLSNLVFWFLLCASTLVVVYAFPFDSLSHYLEFRSNRTTREAIVRDVQTGFIVPVAPAVGLGIPAPHRTIDGHEIALTEIDGHPTAFFYTMRSSDAWEGWLYVPEGANPDHFMPQSRHKRRRMDSHWIYYCY